MHTKVPYQLFLVDCDTSTEKNKVESGLDTVVVRIGKNTLADAINEQNHHQSQNSLKTTVFSHHKILKFKKEKLAVVSIHQHSTL